MKSTLTLRLAMEPTVHYGKKSGKACLRIVGYLKEVTSNGFVKGPGRRIVSFAYGKTAQKIHKAHLLGGTTVRVDLASANTGALFCNDLSIVL